MPLSDDIDEFLKEFQRESDRAAAILGAAYLDIRLELLIQSKFVTGPRFVTELLSGQGGLATFSSRISVAFATGLISLYAAEDLHRVRKIRNKFAHGSAGLSFATHEVIQQVDQLRIGADLLPAEGLDSLPARRRFNVAVAVLLISGIEHRIDTMPAFHPAAVNAPHE